jgi:hypothetical protein
MAACMLRSMHMVLDQRTSCQSTHELSINYWHLAFFTAKIEARTHTCSCREQTLQERRQLACMNAAFFSHSPSLDQASHCAVSSTQARLSTTFR